MKLKVNIFFAALYATHTQCYAQATTAYSPNKAADSLLIKALHYINTGSPGNGGSVDSLVVAVQSLESAIKQDPLFVTAYFVVNHTRIRSI